MADSSFDIVSKFDRQEVDNALGQAAREIATRFDFKGTGATIEWKGENVIEISASADDRASAVLDVFQQKLIKRDVSLKVLDASDPRQSGTESKIGITLKEGISSEDAKKISKLIRDEGPKGVKAQIQGDELRGLLQEARRPPGRAAAGQGTGLRVRGAVHELPLTPSSRRSALGSSDGTAQAQRNASATPSTVSPTRSLILRCGLAGGPPRAGSGRRRTS